MVAPLDTSGPPVFVPVALALDEAQALQGAAHVVFTSLMASRQAPTHGRELARAMVTLARAVDKATGQTEDTV